MKISSKNTILINFNNKEYHIKKDRLVYILNILKNTKYAKEFNDEEIHVLLNKYSLLDEHFLNNINKL